MDTLSDNELMASFQKGNQEAYETLYRRHALRVFRFILLYTGNKESAEDIVQETFLRVYRYRHQFNREKASFRTWLHRIAHRLAIDHFRKQGSAVWGELPPETSINQDKTSSDPTAKTVNDQLLIYKYLQMLPRESRAVLILAYYEDLPGKEIARFSISLWVR